MSQFLYSEHLVKLKRELAVEYLKQQIKIINGEHFDDKFINVPYSQEFNEYFGIHPFYIKKGIFVFIYFNIFNTYNK